MERLNRSENPDFPPPNVRGYGQEPTEEDLGGDESSPEGPYPNEVGGSQYQGPEGDFGGGAPLTYESAIKELTDPQAGLEKQIQTSNFPADQKKKVLQDLNTLKNHLRGKHGPLPQDLAAQVYALEAAVVGDGSEGGPTDGSGDGGPSIKDQVTEVEKLIQSSHMTDDDKQKKKAQLEALVNLKGSQDTDVQGTIDSIKQEAQLYTDHSAAAINLARQLSGGGSSEGAEGASNDALPDEATIKNLEDIAKKHGVDLNSPPNPPTKELLDFLKEASPELGQKFDAVKQAAGDRQTFYQNELTQAKAVNANNTSSTDDDDNKDVSHHQHLYDIKYYQDDKSKALVSAMQDASKETAGLLGALYGKKVDTVQPETGSGWQSTYNQAKVADQISINGNKIDLFNNTSGEVQPSGTPDTETIETVTVEFDGSGDHKWDPPGDAYGDGDFKKEDYDHDLHGWDKTKAKLGIFGNALDDFGRAWNFLKNPSLGGAWTETKHVAGEVWDGIKSLNPF